MQKLRQPLLLDDEPQVGHPLIRWLGMTGHPPGLAVLFFTECWERFSFYGLTALLVLYLNSGVLAEDRLPHLIGGPILIAAFGQPRTAEEVEALSMMVFGLYTGAAYILPLAGGLLADRLLGPRLTMLLGGLLMAVGHACMTVERLFILGLVLTAVGNGGFKPNVSAQLGRLYEAPGEACGIEQRSC
jgi:proton-dependent oligopeptide transporter, POT family